MVEKDGVLSVKFHDSLEGDSYQLLLPEELRPTLLDALHNQAGHQGQERTLALIRRRCYWPLMLEDGARNTRDAPWPKHPLPALGRLWAHYSDKPLAILAIEFTVLEHSKDSRENVLAMTDVISKLSQAVPCRNQKSSTVAKVLVKEWFQKYGVPRRIHSEFT